MAYTLKIGNSGFVLLDDAGALVLAHQSPNMIVVDNRETSQPSPIATRAETEAAPGSVAEAQGHSKQPVAFRYKYNGQWRYTVDEPNASFWDHSYQGLYVRDGQ